MDQAFFTPDAIKSMSNQQIAEACEAQVGGLPPYVIAELYRRLDDLSMYTLGRRPSEDLFSCVERMDVATPFPQSK